MLDLLSPHKKPKTNKQTKYNKQTNKQTLSELDPICENFLDPHMGAVSHLDGTMNRLDGALPGRKPDDMFSHGNVLL